MVLLSIVSILPPLGRAGGFFKPGKPADET
jgi:hypothetical protein